MDISLWFFSLGPQTKVYATKQPHRAIKQLSIADGTLLDRFTPPSSQFAWWQGSKRVGVDQHEPRLMKCAYQILSGGKIHTGLATNRRIDLRKQRRRYLNECDAAQIACCCEPREIADHAAAQSDNCIVSFDP